MVALPGERDLGGSALAARAPSAPAGGGVRALWIGGQERPASDGGSFEVENPATGAPDYVVARGGPADVDLPYRRPGAPQRVPGRRCTRANGAGSSGGRRRSSRTAPTRSPRSK